MANPHQHDSHPVWTLTQWLTVPALLGILVGPPIGHAEWYVGSDLGGVFSHNFTNIEGTGTALGVPASGTRFNDLKTTPGISLGMKGGYFFESLHWLGVEGNIQASFPKIKSQAFNGTGPSLTINASVTEGTAQVYVPSLNLIARYPGEKIQPYVGAGPAVAIIKTFDNGSTSAKAGVNVMAGLRYFLNKEVAFFTEYQYLRTMFASDHGLSPTLGVQGDYSASHLLFGVSVHRK